MRLIDADTLDDVVSMLNEKGRGITRHEYKVMEGVLFAFKTIEVVRCGECKHHDKFPCNVIEDGWFCADGERRS